MNVAIIARMADRPDARVARARTLVAQLVDRAVEARVLLAMHQPQPGGSLTRVVAMEQVTAEIDELRALDELLAELGSAGARGAEEAASVARAVQNQCIREIEAGDFDELFEQLVSERSIGARRQRFASLTYQVIDDVVAALAGRRLRGRA